MNENTTETIIQPLDNKELKLDKEQSEEVKQNIESWKKDPTLDPIQNKLIKEVEFDLLDDSAKAIIEKYLQFQIENLDERIPNVGKINSWNLLEQQIAEQFKEIEKILSLGFKPEYDRELDRLKSQIISLGWDKAEQKRIEIEKKYYFDLYIKRRALDFIHHFVIEKLSELNANKPKKGELKYDSTKFNI